MDSIPKIVVLTPMKNESWIIDLFLQVTSTFADKIIIADQNSTDESIKICQRYEKVHLIQNSDNQYNEASRQTLLIKTARKLVPEHKILLALDCDEILAANSLQSVGWKKMIHASPGTMLFFKKPNLFMSTEWYDEAPADFLGGFIDDGSPHNPELIHSIRLPQPDNAPKLIIEDVVFMHYCLIRPKAQEAKYRMYCALENMEGTKSLYTRRRYYNSKRVLKPIHEVKKTNQDWFKGWEDQNIEPKTIKDEKYYWQNDVTLDLIINNGSKRFWLDDIWNFDWNDLLKRRLDLPHIKIKYPPFLLRFISRILFNLIFLIADIKNSLLSRSK